MATGNKTRHPIRLVQPFGVVGERPGVGHQSVYPFGASGIGLPGAIDLGGLVYYYAFDQIGTPGMRESVSAFDPDLNIPGSIVADGTAAYTARQTPIAWSNGIGAANATYRPGGYVYNGQAQGGAIMAVSVACWTSDQWNIMGGSGEQAVYGGAGLVGNVGFYCQYIGFEFDGGMTTDCPVYVHLVMNGNNQVAAPYALTRGKLAYITAIRAGNLGWLFVNGDLVITAGTWGYYAGDAGAVFPLLRMSGNGADCFDELAYFARLEDYGMVAEVDSAAEFATAMWNGGRYRMYRPTAPDADEAGFTCAAETVAVSGAHALLDGTFTFDAEGFEETGLCGIWAVYLNAARTLLMYRINGAWSITGYTAGVYSVVLARGEAALDDNGDELPWPTGAWEPADNVFQLAGAGYPAANTWYAEQGSANSRPAYVGTGIAGESSVSMSVSFDATNAWWGVYGNDGSLYYLARGRTGTPPATGWEVFNPPSGDPAPTLTWLVEGLRIVDAVGGSYDMRGVYLEGTEVWTGRSVWVCTENADYRARWNGTTWYLANPYAGCYINFAATGLTPPEFGWGPAPV